MPCPFFFGRKWGVFSIGQAKTLEEIERNPKDCLMTDISLLLSNLENVSLSEDAAKRFSSGEKAAYCFAGYGSYCGISRRTVFRDSIYRKWCITSKESIFVRDYEYY